MTVTRMNLWRLGNDWNPTMLWYAQAVRDLQKRPITNATSWTYLAAMHGFDRELWQGYGYIEATTPLPPAATRRRDWDQCQHQSWYFLPWHRGYLAAFEAIVRDAIVKLGGPADWACRTGTTAMPPTRAPASCRPPSPPRRCPTARPTPSRRPSRYGVHGAGRVVSIRNDASVTSALSESEFPGDASGGTAASAVPRRRSATPDRTSTRPIPAACSRIHPHNIVHGLIGGFRRGGNPNSALDNGLMSMPDTAALDPSSGCITPISIACGRSGCGATQACNATAAAWLDGPAARPEIRDAGCRRRSLHLHGAGNAGYVRAPVGLCL